MAVQRWVTEHIGTDSTSKWSRKRVSGHGERILQIAETLHNTEKAIKIQRRMLEAARRPRNCEQLDARLRDGGFEAICLAVGSQSVE